MNIARASRTSSYNYKTEKPLFPNPAEKRIHGILQHDLIQEIPLEILKQESACFLSSHPKKNSRHQRYYWNMSNPTCLGWKQCKEYQVQLCKSPFLSYPSLTKAFITSSTRRPESINSCSWQHLPFYPILP